MLNVPGSYLCADLLPACFHRGYFLKQFRELHASNSVSLCYIQYLLIKQKACLMGIKVTQLVAAAVILITSCWVDNVHAQVYCPPNIDFEQGSLTNWDFYTANNNGSAGI